MLGQGRYTAGGVKEDGICVRGRVEGGRDVSVYVIKDFVEGVGRGSVRCEVVRFFFESRVFGGGARWRDGTDGTVGGGRSCFGWEGRRQGGGEGWIWGWEVGGCVFSYVVMAMRGCEAVL